MITIKTKGNFSNTEKFLHRAKKLNIRKTLNKYGAIGVSKLSAATPKNSGNTASMWRYDVSTTSNGSSITWVNDADAGGIPIVILLQYGHATGTGGYVQGTDFINPALKSIFRDMADDVWMEVTNK